MFLKEIEGEYGIITRVNVPYLEESVRWYEEKLGLKNDRRFYVSGVWAQLNFPGIKNTALGLSVGTPTPTESNVVTIVVSNIRRAQERLRELEVNIGEIEEVGKGVRLAYFTDLVGNRLALRENSNEHPIANEIGDV
jgi:predicted enzyme related to lactoylglutathione lyase